MNTNPSGRQLYKVPFNDLSIADPETRARYLAAIEKVMIHGRILLGPEVDKLESALAARLQRRYAVGVGSGTDALILAFMALDIGPGDEVILGALSWIASANAVKMVGANPVFVDVGDDMTIDPDTIEAAITARTKAILVVDYAGKVCRMEEISELARRHRIPLVEDAAQAFGATHNGKPAGSFGVMSCLSMNPMKVFGALGEAGAVLTDSEELHRALIDLRYNGMRDRIVSHRPGFNARIDTLHAAVMLRRLEEFPGNLSRRQYVGQRYNSAITAAVWKPVESSGNTHSWFCYCVRHTRRAALFDALTRRGIECKTREWDFLPAHPALAQERVVSSDLARKISAEMLCLPIFETISDEEVDIVATAFNEVFDEVTATASSAAP